MLILVDPNSGVLVYRQLMDQIKFHISSGMLKPGDELPSTRALSTELGVNPMTISKAYGYLEREDVLERRRGRPLMVKAMNREASEDLKMDQLEESLKTSVTVVRQLDIDREDAVGKFDQMIRDTDVDGKE